jgi:thioesterase domain-containing protein
VAVFAESVREAAAGKPFALAGISSGGLFAHAAAAYLERLGHGPRAVVMLDTYVVQNEATKDIWDRMLYGLLDRETEIGPFTSARLSSMGRYVRLIGEGGIGEVEAPVLFVRAEEPLLAGADGVRPDGDEWRASFDSAHTTLQVPGDHFTIMEDGHVATTAQAVESWLRTTL